MAMRGQVKLNLTAREAERLVCYLRWKITLPDSIGVGLLGKDYSQTERERLQKLGQKFEKIISRRRRGTEFTIIIERTDLRWMADDYYRKTGMFGRSFADFRPPLFDLSLALKLHDVASARQGRKKLSRSKLCEQRSLDERWEKRLRNRLCHVRRQEAWISRRVAAGEPVGLLYLHDPKDPFPDLT